MLIRCAILGLAELDYLLLDGVAMSHDESAQLSLRRGLRCLLAINPVQHDAARCSWEQSVRSVNGQRGTVPPLSGAGRMRSSGVFSKCSQHCAAPEVSV